MVKHYVGYIHSLFSISSSVVSNKCIGDDTKATAPQRLNCIKNKKNMAKKNDFYRAMRCKRGLCCHAVSVRLSVCLSVTFVDHVKTNKGIFEIFSPSDSDTILVFPSQRGCRYSDGNPP